MTYIETVPEEQATGALAELYAADRATFGRLPNLTQVFSARPEIYAAWKGLNGAIKARMDLRRYELATLAAARRMRSSYCMLAHGAVLADRFLGADGVRAVAADHHAAGLDPAEVAVMDLAEKVADDATRVTQADIDDLRAHGLSDGEILEVVTAAAVRCFFSKVLDALGAEPDHAFQDMEPALRDVLTVGRPIAQAP
jgi:uncharacterized peroxidase-related enzyme